jgi:hypothetical protein
MATRVHEHNLSLVEAVETLSSIADLEFDREIGIAQKHEIMLGNEKIAYKTVHWLHQEDAASTVNLVKETFRVVLHYLKQFYKNEYGSVTDQKTIEEIKSIMVLVGEAARKLDKHLHAFNQTQSVMDFKEYKQLQEFYRAKIARKIEEGVVGKWLVGLSLGNQSSQKEGFKAPPTKKDKWTDTRHVFVDFETVKKDTEYELFFIRKEDGSRFFSPRLLRNIKLVCDFGSYFGERKGLDPLEQVKQWVDRVVHTCAKEILKAVGSRLERFFHESRKAKDQELVDVLNKALLALMLSSHARNLLRHQPIKCCTEYFEDFQKFLRKALQTTIYQRWLAYPPKEDNQLAFDLMDLVRTLCRALYANLRGLEEMNSVVQGLIQQAETLVSREQGEEKPSTQRVWSRLAAEYQAMTKLLKHHPNGPLFKVIEMLEEDTFHVFDPLLQHNMPNQLFDLYAEDRRYAFMRLAAPVYQEFINRAVINEEFKAFMQQYIQGANPRKHLLINLQDRTSWREHARCAALEEFQQQPGMENALSVVTLAADTDFYHQLSPYHQINHASTFMEQFKELLLDENSGYFFPPTIKRKELSDFIDGTFEAIHRIFFSSKNVLQRENRLDFIEIFYLFLQLKLVEWVQPDSVSLSCKDSIDTGEAYNAELFAFLKLINNQEWTDHDWQHLHVMLYAPALLIRERVMLPDRFNRLLSALRATENARYEFGAEPFAQLVQEGFAGLFKTPILHSHLLLPR